MPFAVPWTDASRELLGRNGFQHHWTARAALRPESWKINFLVRRNDIVIGTQSLSGQDFAITREVGSGSWIGMRHQGNGYGTEMRAAVLALAFDHLDAVQARSCAFSDNPASLRVSRKLGYAEDGTIRHARRGKAASEIRLLLSREAFARHRPPWTVEVSNLAPCLPLLGISPG
jgi:RimJ/RimL family protein N-acetyltransferase